MCCVSECVCIAQGSPHWAASTASCACCSRQGPWCSGRSSWPRRRRCSCNWAASPWYAYHLALKDLICLFRSVSLCRGVSLHPQRGTHTRTRTHIHITRWDAVSVTRCVCWAGALSKVKRLSEQALQLQLGDGDRDTHTAGSSKLKGLQQHVADTYAWPAALAKAQWARPLAPPPLFCFAAFVTPTLTAHSAQFALLFTGLVACCHPCLVLLPRAITLAGCTARENQGSGRLDFAVQERSGASPAQPTRKEKQYVLFVVDSAMIETSSMNLLSLVLAPTGRTARLRRGRCCSKRPRCATSPAQCCRIPRACTARPNVRAALQTARASCGRESRLY